MTFEIAHYWVYFLIPLPILVVWLLPVFRKKQSSLIYPEFNSAVKVTKQMPLKSAWISKRNALQWITIVLIWLLLIFALSSPQLVGQAELKTKTSRSFLIAADLSFSMDTRDWFIDNERVSRWEGVRQLMTRFIEQREGDRIGLVFFGTNAYMQAPLTTDLDVIKWNLNETEVGMAGQTTGIGNAIGYSVKLFEQDSLQNRVLLLLTDGVDSGSDIAPLDAAHLAKKDSIIIYTIGIGDAGKQGADLDETTLKEISRITGGQYFLGKDEAQLKLAYETLNELEPMEFEEENYKPRILLYHYPMAAALVLGLLFMLIASLINFIQKRES